MAFMSKWRKTNLLPQERNKKTLPKLATITEKSGSVSAREEERLRFFLTAALLISLSLILIVAVTSISREEVFLPILHVASPLQRTAISRLKAEREAQNFLIKPESMGRIFIEDAIILPEELLLLLRSSPSFIMDKKQLSCIFFNQSKSEALRADDIDGRIAVRCGIPASFGLPPLVSGIKLLIQSRGQEEILVEFLNKSESFAKWDYLVFESLALPSETILFAKGFGQKHGQEMDAELWRCSFEGLVDTHVTIAAQEVFVCENPPLSLRAKLCGRKVTLRRKGEVIPSVTYYRPDQLIKEFSGKDIIPRSPKRLLCACTMIFNGAKFLKEWVKYHSFLGVEHFYVYDNNSEDDLRGAVHSLALSNYSISRHPWPWIKSQEAGFSHCSQQARPHCTWMMYTDIDEFVFPQTAWLPQFKGNSSRRNETAPDKFVSSPNLLQKLVLKTLMTAKKVGKKERVGQISLKCRDFGPSGLKKTPLEGVMEAYTCRMKKEQRHKSIVLLDAIANSRINVVHHFKLKPEYVTVQLSVRKAVINHYKYQVWEEFKRKFRRRVSAYVTDWREEKKMDSKDRAPGLGTNEAVEPPGWENRFCEVYDTSLRDYSRYVSNFSLSMPNQLEIDSHSSVKATLGSFLGANF